MAATPNAKWKQTDPTEILEASVQINLLQPDFYM